MTSGNTPPDRRRLLLGGSALLAVLVASPARALRLVDASGEDQRLLRHRRDEAAFHDELVVSLRDRLAALGHEPTRIDSLVSSLTCPVCGSGGLTKDR